MVIVVCCLTFAPRPTRLSLSIQLRIDRRNLRLIMSLPAAINHASRAAASHAGPPPTRPVVVTLYRNLLRLSQRYGVVAQHSKQTIQHEIDRLLPTQPPTAATSSSSSTASKSVQVSAIPISTSAGPAIAIAFSSARGDSSSPSTTLLAPSSSPSVSSSSSSDPASLGKLLSSSTSSLDPAGVMSPSIAVQLVQSQFRLHRDEQRPAHIQRHISHAFTALRKLKDRHNALTALTHSTAATRLAASAHSSSSTQTATTLVAGQTFTSHSTPNFSVKESSGQPPLLHSLHTANTTESTHTRIHIAASHSRSTPLRVLSHSQSTPSHLFTYTLTITNTHPTASIQLLSRRWLFTDSSGRQQQVTGEGVVGRQPVLEASGGSFQYTSGVSLAERKGRMEGSFRFRVVSVEKDSSKKKRGRGSRGKARDDGAEDGGVVPVEAVEVEGEEVKEQGEGERVGDEFDAPVGPVLLDAGESEHERVG